ncbi:hypothetical protein NGRA_3289 [Nosema granulosis]|uniref:Retrotransposon gag domain-containing protein n=1 Tax=Nosema granulosis TaxID=83296 RepID=A0A9P6GVR7_9MICR|nr:hypothetical protein NGRA_3289 [Nosema granulosis]
MMVIKKGDSKLKDWFYEKGTDGTLPDTWEDFKAQIVDLCMEQALESSQRYNNEPWSSYISRLKDKALSSKIPEQEVFKKLRRERAPETFRQLFYSFGVTLDNVIERINEFETNAKERNEKYQRDERYDNRRIIQKKHIKSRLLYM